jgi:hypothetical protein
MSRNWTWIEDADESNMTDEQLAEMEAKHDAITPVLDRLAREWSNLTEMEERRGWDRQARMEDGDYEPDYDTDEEAEAARLMAREMDTVRAARHDAEVSAIESALARHGARMMRPYEHWNEDEAYMAYAERDRY